MGCRKAINCLQTLGSMEMEEGNMQLSIMQNAYLIRDWLSCGDLWQSRQRRCEACAHTVLFMSALMRESACFNHD